MLENIGIVDGFFTWQCDDGCDVGQSETKEYSEERLLGAALTDGDSGGIDDG